MRSKGVFGVLVVTTILIFIVSLNIRNVKEIQLPGTRISVHASNETIVPRDYRSLVRVPGAGDEIMRMVDVSENIVNDNGSRNLPPNWYRCQDVEIKQKATSRGGQGNTVLDIFLRTCSVLVVLTSLVIVWIVALHKNPSFSESCRIDNMTSNVYEAPLNVSHEWENLLPVSFSI